MAVETSTNFLEARLFAGNYASRGDILRMKSLGVQWDGNTRSYEPEVVPEEGPPWPIF